MVTYRVAVVGLGHIGWRADWDRQRPSPASHVSAWLNCPRAELVAVADHNEATCSNAWNDPLMPDGCLVYHLPDALWLKYPPDIMSIATPPASHREVVTACAEAGVRLVICEKPLASTSKDALAMVEACRASGTTLLVNHGRRFHPLLRQARADLVAGRIGKPLSAVATCSGGLWRGQSHMVDLLRFFLGDVGWVVGHRRGPCSEDGLEDGYDALLWFRDGARATLHAVDIARYVAFDLNILGETGALRVDAYGCRVLWARAEDSYPLASGYRWLVEDGAPGVVPWTTFLGEMTAHAVAVLDGTDTATSTGEDGLECVRILEAIERSDRANGPTVPGTT